MIAQLFIIVSQFTNELQAKYYLKFNCPRNKYFRNPLPLVTMCWLVTSQRPTLLYGMHF